MFDRAKRVDICPCVLKWDTRALDFGDSIGRLRESISSGKIVGIFYCKFNGNSIQEIVFPVIFRIQRISSEQISFSQRKIHSF